MPELRPAPRPSAACFVALALAALAPAHALAGQAAPGRLVVEPVPYAAYAGTAVPVVARRPGATAADDTNGVVVWRSSDARVAWVGADGLLVFERPGRVTISAESGAASAEREFEVRAPHADRIDLAPPPSALAVGSEFALEARVADGSHALRDGRIAYGVGLRGVARAARLDTAGRFSASAAGGYPLVASLGDVGEVVVVLVGDAPRTTAPLPRGADRGDGVRGIDLGAAGDYEPYVGTSLPLAARVTPRDGAVAPAVVWSSSDPSVAWVDAGGVVHFVRRGSARVAATAGGHRAERGFDVREAGVYRVLLRAAQGDALPAVGDSVRLSVEAWAFGGAHVQHPRAELAVTAADGAAAGPRVTISEAGDFVAAAPGTYLVTAVLGGRASSVALVVTPRR